MSTIEAHRQSAYRVRVDWGPTGAAAIAEGADVAVVVDVLSFTTTLSVAVERGITVLPFRWKDERAAAYAEEQGAVLARGRSERDGVSLSPLSVRAATGVERLVLPSPNGSTIAFELATRGARVVGACLRNATAVARWLPEGATVAVVAAGERWPDGSLRPAVEDLWGPRLACRLRRHAGRGSVRAQTPDDVVAAGGRVADRRPRLAEELRDCASGRELVEMGFAGDVDVAAELDASAAVPVLEGEAFVAVADSRP